MDFKLKLKKFSSDKFVYRSVLYTILLALLYTWKSCIEGFTFASWIIMGFSVTYSILFFIFRRSAFYITQLIYSIALVILEYQYDSGASSNFTAFFCLTMAILVNPGFKKLSLIIYFAVTFGFALYIKEDLYDIAAHYVRCLWIMEVVTDLISHNFEKKKLVLTDDEVKILKQYDESGMLKTVDCFSKNTVTKKINQACKRNNLISKYELLAEFRKSH